MSGAHELPMDTTALLDEAACGLLQTSASDVILRVNETFCTWVGYSKVELVGRKFQELLTVGGRIFHQTHWTPLLRLQGSVSEVKLDFLRKDETTVPMVLNARRSELHGELRHELAAFVARDRDKYEKELLQSRKRLEELVTEATRLQEEAKDRALFAEQMIGIVSHDLRNPMSIIGMSATLLANAELPASSQQVVARIIRAGDRANWLIDDLLDFTQTRFGKGLSVSKDEIELHQVISDAVDELTQVYPQRVLVHERLGLTESCLADGQRLAQLVGNLVSNAMTYGDPATPVAVISKIDASGFSVAVHNRGPVIPSAMVKELFEPMTRGPNATQSGRSVGLGLYIVREIAKAHHGKVSVQSTEPNGTTFEASFPRT